MENEFAKFGFNRQILSAIADCGFVTPTKIQEQAIPLVLQGHDVLAIAQTGTGKTAAYLWPILMKIKYAQQNLPRALILVPTRELAIQIHAEAKRFAKYTDLRIVCLYGGTGIRQQQQALENGADIVVGTPGRVWDLYKASVLSFKELKIFVLDEADKMMDMGFFPQIIRFLEVVPRKRQNLLFSATMAEKVVRLTESFLEDPIKVEITPQATPAQTVSQFVYHTPNFRAKTDLLLFLLADEKTFKKVIVFVRTRKTAETLFSLLEKKLPKNQIRVIHANKDQNSRLNAINAFKESDLRILVATDVVARGIDVAHVSHVINFDVPIVYEDYVHRIGRTGRAFQTGESITFYTEAEYYHLKKIEKLIKSSIPKKQLPEEIQIFPTPYEEQQSMLKEIDLQKKRENPDYQGAFHEKKEVLARKKAKKSKAGKPFDVWKEITKPKKLHSNRPKKNKVST